MTNGVMQGRRRRALGSRCFNISGKHGLGSHQWDRHNDNVPGECWRLKRRCIRTSDEELDQDDARCLGVRPSLVVRGCWFDRAMDVVVPTADGEATATTIAQGQVHVT